MNVAKLPSQIFIGYEADNAWTPVVIDWTEWAEKEPGGVLTVLLQRNGDANPYPVVLTTDGTVSTWKPSSTDTAVPGFGRLQLKYTVGDVVGHSKVLNVNIGRSLEPATDPPDPYESWLDSLTELAAETEQYANSAQQSAEDAEDAQTAAEAAEQSAESYATSAQEAATAASASASAAYTSETNAALFESNAQGYATRAETAQTRAETAQSGAETAESNAQQYASGAAQSATQATNSASSAESSASSAASSATSASASATLAGESATSASGSASSASESASSATQSATSASQSASSASQSATSASGSASSASASATAAATSASSASQSAENATSYATTAQEAAESAAQSASEALETLLDTAPVITDTASGAIASFSDGADGRPVVGLSVGIEPIQSGSGDPSPTNIRPITGHTQTTVTRTDGNGGHATTITIPFGQTVYGGTVDVVNGVLTVDSGIVDMGTLGWAKDANRTGVFYTGNVPMDVPYVGFAKICSDFKVNNSASANNIANGELSSLNSYGSPRLFVKDTARAELSASEFKTAMSGVQLVYKLSTPITIDLTPQQLTTLLGDNNVFADTGDTEVEYRADTKKYIQKMIAAVLSA